MSRMRDNIYRVVELETLKPEDEGIITLFSCKNSWFSSDDLSFWSYKD